MLFDELHFIVDKIAICIFLRAEKVKSRFRNTRFNLDDYNYFGVIKQFGNIYCDVPGSPCLSKNGSNVRSVLLF